MSHFLELFHRQWMEEQPFLEVCYVLVALVGPANCPTKNNNISWRSGGIKPEVVGSIPSPAKYYNIGPSKGLLLLFKRNLELLIVSTTLVMLMQRPFLFKITCKWFISFVPLPQHMDIIRTKWNGMHAILRETVSYPIVLHGCHKQMLTWGNCQLLKNQNTSMKTFWMS